MNSSVCKTVVNGAYNFKTQLPQQMALFTTFRNFAWGNLPLEAQLRVLQNDQIWVKKPDCPNALCQCLCKIVAICPKQKMIQII